MATEFAPIRKIVVRIQVGDHRMSATDDPVFLRLVGPSGREFRLKPHHGNGFRRGAKDEFVLGPPDANDTHVDHPELNDPTRPALDAEGVTAVVLAKGRDPVPNVRGFGEMDDRLEIDWAEVVVHTDTGERRWRREGPIWLGLISGGSFELAPAAGDG